MGRRNISMNNAIRKPVVLAFAGPNGSGKTTVMRGLDVFGTYVNADDIKAEYGISDLEAAQKAELIRNALLNKRVDFSFETVLSTERNLLLLEKAKSVGYEVHCIYVLTHNASINVGRVKVRHAGGGHDVPEDKIRIRYHRALALIPRLLNVCDKMLIYDNSEEIIATILHKESGIVSIFPNEFWTEARLHKLIDL